jgi:hypothetical protein
MAMIARQLGRLKIIAGVKEEKVTLIAASGLMGVSYRQGKRIWRRVAGCFRSGK